MLYKYEPGRRRKPSLSYTNHILVVFLFLFVHWKRKIHKKFHSANNNYHFCNFIFLLNNKNLMKKKKKLNQYKDKIIDFFFEFLLLKFFFSNKQNEIKNNQN